MSSLHNDAVTSIARKRHVASTNSDPPGCAIVGVIYLLNITHFIICHSFIFIDLNACSII